MATPRGNPLVASDNCQLDFESIPDISSKMANNAIDKPEVIGGTFERDSKLNHVHAREPDTNNNQSTKNNHRKQDKKGTSASKFLGSSRNVKTKNAKLKAGSQPAYPTDDGRVTQSNVKPSGQKNLVEELKLFQNSQLLNQQDPIEQLQRQLNELIRDDEDDKKAAKQNHRSKAKKNRRTAGCDPLKQSNSTNLLGTNLNFDKHSTTAGNTNNVQQSGLSTEALQRNAKCTPLDNPNNGAIASSHELHLSNSDSIFTIKKGVLWQHQNYEKFHQRLFSRWKKRYFILTSDYLVSFKRSTSKVGHSEMGKFLYKTSLGDINKLEWMKFRKSDKGAIVLHIKGQFKLFLWCKENLDDWMLMIEESIQRSKKRRSNFISSSLSSYPLGTTNSKNSENPTALAPSSNTVPDEAQLADHKKRPPANHGHDIDENLYENNSAAQSKLEEDNKHDNSAIIKAPKQENLMAPIADAKNKPSTLLNGSANEAQLSQNSNSGSRVPRAHRLKSDSNRVGEKSSDTKGPTAAKRLSNEAEVAGAPAGPERQARPRMINDVGGDNAADERSLGQASRSDGSFITDEQANAKPSAEDLVDQARGSLGEQNATKASDETSNADLVSIQSRNFNESSGSGFASASSRLHRPQNTKTSSTDSRRSSNTSASVSGSMRKTASSRAGSSSGSTVSRLQQHQQSEVQASPRQSASQEAESSQVSTVMSSQKSEQQPGSCNRANNDAHNPAPETNSNPQGSGDNPLAKPRSKNQLIRRDDSWQSLVSLTRIGKSPMQVAQRSLYAQHIMGPSDQRAAAELAEKTDPQVGMHRVWAPTKTSSHQQQHSSINIESTVTPIRSGPLLRQHSIQSGAMSRRFSPLPPIMSQQAASFDQPSVEAGKQRQQNYDGVGAAPEGLQVMQNSPLQANHRSISYQHKLLQLQMMHNNNNNNYDYGQIYGPAESVATNHYGYYSMRSNLKSAASEFSFIRPDSSSFQQHLQQQQQQQHQQQHQQQPPVFPQPQSTLPHQSSSYQLHSVGGNHNPQQAFLRQTPLRSSLAVPMSGVDNARNPTTDFGLPQSPALSLAGQQQQPIVLGADRMSTLAELVASTAPNRELPLKPNKRRGEQLASNMAEQLGAKGSAGSASSSLGSSIVCFLRRAFSRRSSGKSSNCKRRSKALAAESCSSSLGNFDERYPTNIHVLPSAFSTGGKSLDEQLSLHKQQNSQRMVDMIEAFKNKTLIEPHQMGASSNNDNPGSANVNQHMFAEHNDKLIGSDQAGQHLMTPNKPGPLKPMARNQFGSPLHKSNSISTTMGLSGLNATNSLQRNYPRHLYKQVKQSSLVYDNQTELIGSSGVNCGPSDALPMLRSNKVLSANLTPIFANSNHNDTLGTAGPAAPNNQTPTSTRHLFMSPRSRPEHMPRPSSIYGQPSMISSSTSSPISSRFDANERSGHSQVNNNFGLHRSSIHGANYIDHSSQVGPFNRVANQQHQASLAEFRASLAATPGSLRNHHHHHQLVKVPQYLDTTCEVAEESIASPTSENEILAQTDGPLSSASNNLVHSKHGIITAQGNNPMMTSNVAGSQSDNAGLGHQIDTSYGNNSSKFNPNHRAQQRQAIVNPIQLQSPTMHTIYDNHPLLNGHQEPTYISSSNHYDNHQGVGIRQNPSSSRFSEDQSRISPNVMQSNSPFVTDYHQLNNRRVNISSADFTPSRMAANVLGAGGKPSAIVAPSTPNHGYDRQHQLSDLVVDSPARRAAIMVSKQHQQQPQSPLASGLYPARRSGASNQQPQPHSPLVGQRDSSRRAPATAIINSSVSAMNFQQSMYHQHDGDKMLHNGGGDPSYQANELSEMPVVVNIAGAPGINLEPSLAASLLRGTNIDAFELSVQSGYKPNPDGQPMMTPSSRRVYGQSQPKTLSSSKTFLVASRLSKSMATEAATAASAAEMSHPGSYHHLQESSYDNLNNSGSRMLSEDSVRLDETDEGSGTGGDGGRAAGRQMVRANANSDDADDHDDEDVAASSSGTSSVASESATSKCSTNDGQPSAKGRSRGANGSGTNRVSNIPKSSPRRQKADDDRMRAQHNKGKPALFHAKTSIRASSNSGSDESSASRNSCNTTEPEEEEARNWITSKLVNE